MKEGKKRKEELEKKIEEYRSKANIDKIKAYQEDPEKYFEKQEEYSEYAQLIERDIVKPFLKKHDRAYKKGIVAYGILAGVFVLASVATHLIAKFTGSTLPTPFISAISGGFAGAGGYMLYSAISDKLTMNKKKKEEVFTKEEWDALKDQPAYIEEFITRNNVQIWNYNAVERHASAQSYVQIESPLDENTLF